MIKKWFLNRLKTIMEHNEYEQEWLTESVCNEHEKWTPCDLIAREYLNNGCGSSKGFLGITPSECRKCYDYMKEHKDYLVENDLVNEKAWNNSGFPLWSNYNF